MWRLRVVRERGLLVATYLRRIAVLAYQPTAGVLVFRRRLLYDATCGFSNYRLSSEENDQ